mmetsp:Transcript_126694/g.354670  ORF Transcript_126694/g.354670 Transcript_126694/m.354670 type:complete len:221 (-) Transcript_126694:1143-1805(-)
MALVASCRRPLGAAAALRPLFVAVVVVLVVARAHLRVLPPRGAGRGQQRRGCPAAPRGDGAVVHGAALRLHDPEVGAEEADEAHDPEDAACARQGQEPRAEHHDEGAEPIDDAARAEARAPDLHRIDLRQIQPCHGAQAEAEGHHEHGEADDGDEAGQPTRTQSAALQAHRDHEEGHRDGLAEGADEQQSPTAQVVHQAGAQQRGEDVRRRHAGRRERQA